MHNAIKHANATEILLQLVQHEDHLEIVVEDNGDGFDHTKRHQGAGLLNIETRLIYLDAKMKIDSQLGNGTSINLELPLSDKTPEVGIEQKK